MTNKSYLIVSNNSHLPSDRVLQMSVYLGDKGYGDNFQELQFISDFFKTIFLNHKVLHSFEWCQYQDWSDQGLYFDLKSYIINENLTINHNFYGFENAPNYNFNSNFNLDYNFLNSEHDNIELPDNEIGWERYKEFFDNYQKSLEPLKLVVDYILIFLKSLYEHHRPYYFIYLFGRRSKVRITRSGIEIFNNEVNYLDGNSYDNKFNIT